MLLNKTVRIKAMRSPIFEFSGHSALPILRRNVR